MTIDIHAFRAGVMMSQTCADLAAAGYVPLLVLGIKRNGTGTAARLGLHPDMRPEDITALVTELLEQLQRKGEQK